jgi:hypothetical protein
VTRVRQEFESRMLAKPPPIDPQIRTDLLAGYTTEFPKLQDLAGQDLSLWLEYDDRKHASAEG